MYSESERTVMGLLWVRTRILVQSDMVTRVTAVADDLCLILATAVVEVVNLCLILATSLVLLSWCFNVYHCGDRVDVSDKMSGNAGEGAVEIDHCRLRCSRIACL